jgi:20S proteasome alpha/beta subunit
MPFFSLLLLAFPFFQGANCSTPSPWLGGAVNRAPSVTAAEEESIYADLPPTVFSPSGRLVAVERAVPRVTLPADRSSSLVVSIRCRHGTVVVSSLPKSPYLYDPRNTENNGTATTGTPNSTPANVTQSTTADVPLAILFNTSDSESWNRGLPLPFCRLAPQLFGIAAGNAADAQLVRHRLLRIAHGFFLDGHASSIPARAVARQWADECHYRTLQDGSDDARILACSSILFDSQELWRVEPPGQFYLCRAAAAGRDAPRAEKLLVEALTRRAADSQKNLTGDSETDGLDGSHSTSSTGDNSSQLSAHSADGSVSGSRIRQVILELTFDEALAIACQTILATLQRDTTTTGGRVDADGGRDPAVRVLGLSLGDDNVEWHDQDRLLHLIEQSAMRSRNNVYN